MKRFIWKVILFMALLSVLGCNIPGPGRELSIKERLDTKLNREFEQLGPLSNLGMFGSYFTKKYNGKEYMHERHAQFNWVVPALTPKAWQENAKTRSWMFGQYGHVMPIK